MANQDLVTDDLLLPNVKFMMKNDKSPRHPSPIEVITPQIFQSNHQPGPTRPTRIPLYVQNVANFGESKIFQNRDRCLSENSATSATSGGGSGNSTPDDCYNIEGHSLINPSRLVQGSGMGISMEKSHRLIMQRIYHLRHAIAVLVLVFVFAVSLCATILATEMRDEFVISPEDERSLPPIPGQSAPPQLGSPSEYYDDYENDEQQQVLSNPIMNGPIIINHSPIKSHGNVVVIRSAADLQKNLDSKCDTVTVTLLNEDFDSNDLASIPGERTGGGEVVVKNLQIIGPVSEAWLRHLLTTRFQKIENLTLDVTQLCLHENEEEEEERRKTKNGVKALRKGGVNNNKRGILTLENVKSLTVQNSQVCSISSWIFEWEMPNIQYLSVYDSDLIKEVYDPIHRLFERNKNTLTSITISRSFLCDDCPYTDVQFRALKQFVISEQLEEPKNKGEQNS